MSPNKTLYIREDDVPTWERAEQAAKATSQSVSQLVTVALQHYLPSVQTPAGHMQQLTVEVGEPAMSVGFVGRCLVEPDSDETRSDEEGQDAGAYWGVALTKRGRIAVYTAHCNERWPAALTDFDNLDEAAARGGVPDDILAMAATALGQERVVWRDI